MYSDRSTLYTRPEITVLYPPLAHVFLELAYLMSRTIRFSFSLLCGLFLFLRLIIEMNRVQADRRGTCPSHKICITPSERYVSVGRPCQHLLEACCITFQDTAGSVRAAHNVKKRTSVLLLSEWDPECNWLFMLRGTTRLKFTRTRVWYHAPRGRVRQRFMARGQSSLPRPSTSWRSLFYMMIEEICLRWTI
jgi:hypothetical protein